jgi:hypothetical protein
MREELFLSIQNQRFLTKKLRNVKICDIQFPATVLTDSNFLRGVVMFVICVRPKLIIQVLKFCFFSL